ncbi:MAG: hypothetical protein IT306_30430 [Chloroflexi bacterium]|nr:hypothetical protein [Chloroflexota bacterium]
MFGFFKRPSARPLTTTIMHAVERDGPSSPAPLNTLLMVEMSGRYSDRKVTYFRVFDPATAAQRMVEVKRYADLDAFQNLIVQSGHVESDGKVVVTRDVRARGAQPAARSAADRSQHLDDAHIVVHGETGASANPRPKVSPSTD